MNLGETWRRALVMALALVLLGGSLGCTANTTSSSPTKPKINQERDNKGNPVAPPKPDPG